MDPTNSIFHVLDPTSTTSSSTVSQKIRPYPRKWETNLMNSRIKELSLLATSSQLEDVHCDIHHRNPALVFSSGGYTGNPYHDFDDGFIPLFITLRTAYPSSEDQPILVISKCEDWRLDKYSELLKIFSPCPIINLDHETSTHCFPSATVGLISHGFMTIDPTLLPNSETLRDFRALLESAYAKTGLQTNPTISALSASTPTPRPRLLVVSRAGENVGRVMSNQAEVVLLAKEIGFDVTIFEPTKFTSVTETYRLLNSAHTVVGVHGAAMTNLLFLRPGSVFMQVVPIGTDWAAEVCYGKPAKEIGLDYMEYKIKVNESTLVDKYGKDSMVVKDPKSVSKKDWSIIKKIYFIEQNVRVNLVRFEKHLRKAYKKAKKFMDNMGYN
ncbi:protein O-linked-mannose beta-1,4-N-acetylglucosaminyltransferase 2-like [Papaver somniferum]|nr:protein O-linked-mannose beta-1,4-N-acetylglucosaminyltransferase 2-like [Papaver somniferum]